MTQDVNIAESEEQEMNRLIHENYPKIREFKGKIYSYKFKPKVCFISDPFLMKYKANHSTSFKSIREEAECTYDIPLFPTKNRETMRWNPILSLYNNSNRVSSGEQVHRMVSSLLALIGDSSSYDKALLMFLVLYVLENDNIGMQEKSFHEIIRLLTSIDDIDFFLDMISALYIRDMTSESIYNKYGYFDEAKYYAKVIYTWNDKILEKTRASLLTHLISFIGTDDSYMMTLNVEHPHNNLDVRECLFRPTRIYIGYPEDHPMYQFLKQSISDAITRECIRMQYTYCIAIKDKKAVRPMFYSFQLEKEAKNIVETFKLRKEAESFIETISQDNIIGMDDIQPGSKVYDLMWNNGHGYHSYAYSYDKEILEYNILEIDKADIVCCTFEYESEV